jgi:hypothetical protein
MPEFDTRGMTLYHYSDWSIIYLYMPNLLQILFSIKHNDKNKDELYSTSSQKSVVITLLCLYCKCNCSH